MLTSADITSFIDSEWKCKKVILQKWGSRGRKFKYCYPDQRKSL